MNEANLSRVNGIQFTGVNKKQGQMGGRIRLHIAELMHKQGMEVEQGPFKGEINVTTLSHGTGLNYRTAKSLARGASDATNISFETIARLCQFLACTVGELIEYVPAGVGPKASLSEAYKRDSINGWS